MFFVKKLKSLEKRITALEKEVQEQSNAFEEFMVKRYQQLTKTNRPHDPWKH